MRQSPGLNQNRVGAVGPNSNNATNSFAQRINQSNLSNAGSSIGPPGMQNTPFDYLTQNIKSGQRPAGNITSSDDFPTLNQVNQQRNMDRAIKSWNNRNRYFQQQILVKFSAFFHAQ